MKYLSLKILLCSMIALPFFGCQKEAVPPIGDPASKLEGISDTWKLSGVYQYDEKVANTDLIQYDITDFFITGDAPVITFDAGSKTYAYDAKSSPNFLGAAGSWQFDDDAFPTVIMATENGGSDQVVWSLLGPTRPVDQELKLAVRRGCATDGSYAYLFVFTRQ
jgi:hypothetical protein